ncbi:MAG: phenylacetate--CoA ligase family protein [Coriobacteriia bacterium]|nr:phenylacetate--CoA ligase family protein [Coriobacteriia bacterium]
MLTPLEPWIAAKIGLPPTTPLATALLHDYQLSRLQATIDYVCDRSPFYRQHLAGVRGSDLHTLDDIAMLPFTTPEDILEDDLRFLCVSQGEIERIVTLRTSGTTNAAKRLHFTAQDLQLTVDFFRHGMSPLVNPHERVLILMPGDAPGSVGDLLAQGLARMGAEGIVHGIVQDEQAAISEIVSRRIDCLVGLPVQVLGLARHAAAASVPAGRIKSVLLSADYVPAAIVREIERTWNVPVFNHYGMTEMGLGGAVDCSQRCGCHLREADLYVEIVDPGTSRPVPDGEPGEVVFTTLTRTGMPLVRYRTGDLSRFIPEPCPCGTVLRRLAWVRGRSSGRIRLNGNDLLSMADLDDALFPLRGLLSFQAVLTTEDNKDVLQVSLFTRTDDTEGLRRSAEQALCAVPAVQRAIGGSGLKIGPVIMSDEIWQSSGSIKRTIHDQRGNAPC